MSCSEQMSLITRPGSIDAGPAHDERNAPTALEVRVLLRAERRCAAIRPRHLLGAVVRGEDDDRVVGDLQLVELVEQLADVAVQLDHAVGIEAESGLADGRRFEVREDVHARGVHVAEPRLAFLGLPIHEVERGADELLVDRLHALLRQRPGVLDRLLADLAELRVDRRVVLVGCLALEHAARAELLPERGILRDSPDSRVPASALR